MSGIRRPSSVSSAFQPWKLCLELVEVVPRSASRSGCAASGEMRYWYQEISHATVTTISPLTPESGTDRGFRRAEALRDAGHRAPVRARVEEVGRLDDRELGLGEAPQDRLVGDRRLLGAAG